MIDVYGSWSTWCFGVVACALAWGCGPAAGGGEAEVEPAAVVVGEVGEVSMAPEVWPELGQPMFGAFPEDPANGRVCVNAERGASCGRSVFMQVADVGSYEELRGIVSGAWPGGSLTPTETAGVSAERRPWREFEQEFEARYQSVFAEGGVPEGGYLVAVLAVKTGSTFLKAPNNGPPSGVCDGTAQEGATFADVWARCGMYSVRAIDHGGVVVALVVPGSGSGGRGDVLAWSVGLGEVSLGLEAGEELTPRRLIGGLSQIEQGLYDACVAYSEQGAPAGVQPGFGMPVSWTRQRYVSTLFDRCGFDEPAVASDIHACRVALYRTENSPSDGAQVQAILETIDRAEASDVAAQEELEAFRGHVVACREDFEQRSARCEQALAGAEGMEPRELEDLVCGDVREDVEGACEYGERACSTPELEIGLSDLLRSPSVTLTPP